MGTTPGQHSSQGQGKDAAPRLPPAASWARTSSQVQTPGFCRLQVQNERVFSVHTHINSLISSNLLHQSAVKGTSVGKICKKPNSGRKGIWSKGSLTHQLRNSLTTACWKAASEDSSSLCCPVVVRDYSCRQDGHTPEARSCVCTGAATSWPETKLSHRENNTQLHHFEQSQ